MLFIFFATVIMGFFSGFFYPSSYFPIWVQNIGKWLPTGILFDYIKDCIYGYDAAVSSAKIIGILIIFSVVYQLRERFR